MVTHGLGEVSIIVSKEQRTKIIKAFRSQKPKAEIQNLVGLTVRFKDDYTETENIFYGLLRILASHRTNIVEIVSTFTELTFILHEKDFKDAFDIIHSFFQKNTT